ncbi:astacin-like metalloprotease toxin 2 [Nematostella vectensis]|uniref:astacin-like metalloprotease toxin 2 n=1 Tax=Nematostella vectensis TaxID=45351 RepID=UPI00207740EF|nr:astacin-like metalloprotease toxin 2 [Nematostella vectensis]
MKMWTDTCIRFKQRTNEYAYARFWKGEKCSSHVGHTGRKQDISLAGGCWHAGIVAHEIGEINLLQCTVLKVTHLVSTTSSYALTVTATSRSTGITLYQI